MLKLRALNGLFFLKLAYSYECSCDAHGNGKNICHSTARSYFVSSLQPPEVGDFDPFKKAKEELIYGCANQNKNIVFRMVLWSVHKTCLHPLFMNTVM